MALKFSPMLALPPLLFFGLAVLFMVGMQSDDPNDMPSTREGHPAPDVQLSKLGAGEPFTGEALRAGNVTLVNFWASWCAPCRVEHPQLETLAREGIAIYGINYKDDPNNALGFLAELGDPYLAMGADPRGRTALDWGVYGIPETFVIDGNGKIMLRFAGPITESILESWIRPAMAAAAESTLSEEQNP